MSKATIKDVARVAEVSLKTVSRVINNEPTVKEATRKKVLEAIEELRYQPDMSARNLRGNKSYAVGLVYDNPNPYYVVDVQEGVLQACRELGYSLQIHPCDAETGDIVEELSDLVRNSRLAGLVIAPPISEDDRVTDALYERGIHFVRIVSASSAPAGASPCVYVNDRAAAFAVADHLINKGHSNIAFLLGEEEHHSSGERFKGYRKALEEHGVPVRDDMVLEGSYSFDSGFQRATALLSGDTRPTAIFGCNDEIAAGALAAAKSLGLNVPGDVAIAGFENSPFSKQAQPPLTTAAQSIGDIAKQAMMLLVSELRPQAMTDGNNDRKSEFIPELIARASTDAEAR
ncbi:LacI family DNA-binding transcriptional regulator [Kordiimonas aestuarii]|uniref:LacI family DNA-binding transcriptional regulator n=1 Tax=Kordiimonas aestuarii TaxID=1005925 RepID=UPI0021CFFA2B|nr:LacI family DNA-binding transcriptional regulator [Kordiimonas aestuarii]